MNRGVKHRRDHNRNEDLAYGDVDFERSAKRQRDDFIPSSGSVGQSDGYDEPLYRSLALSRLDHRISDEEVKDMMYREFKKFGDFNVNIVHVAGGPNRLAYINFEQADSARSAMYALKDKLFLAGSCVRIEAVYGSRRSRDDNRYPRNNNGGSSQSSGRDGYDNMTTDRGYVRDGESRYDNGYYPKKFESGGSVGNGGGGRHDQHDLLPEYDDMATRTLFVGNLESNISEMEIRCAFERYGVVEDVDIKHTSSMNSGAFNAYAFVQYANLDMAYAAKTDMAGRCVRGQTCKIGYSKPKPSHVLWLGGLGPRFRAEDVVRDIEKMSGERVEEIDWPPGSNYAFLTFQSKDVANRLHRILRGKDFGEVGRRTRVDFARTESDVGERKFIPRNDARVEYEVREGYHQRGARMMDDRDGRRMWGDAPHPERRSNDTRGESKASGGSTTNRRRTPPSDMRRTSARANEDFRDRDQADELVEAVSFAEVALKAPAVWCGAVALKNSEFMTRMHLLSGDARFVEGTINGSTPAVQRTAVLKVNQRLRIEDAKLEELSKRMQSAGPLNHAVLLALPLVTTDSGAGTAGAQKRPLRNFVSYLKQKEAAGIVALPLDARGGDTEAESSEALLYAFPSCAFSQQLLKARAPHLGDEDCTDDNHLVVIIIKVPL